jgi:hypothetical protein
LRPGQSPPISPKTPVPLVLPGKGNHKTRVGCQISDPWTLLSVKSIALISSPRVLQSPS